MAFERYKHPPSKARNVRRFNFPVVRACCRDRCLHLNKAAQRLLPIGKNLALYFDRESRRICIKPSEGIKDIHRVVEDGLSAARINVTRFMEYFEIDFSKINGQYFAICGDESIPNAHLIDFNEPIENP